MDEKEVLAANEILCKLQNAGTDSEAAIVDDLAIKAGYWWRCDCGWVNLTTDEACASCKRAK